MHRPAFSHCECKNYQTTDSGRLTLRGRNGELELAPGATAFIAAGERVSVENAGEAPASMVVCFAPPTFVTTLLAATEGDAGGPS